jgi:hypothetical protein
VRLLEEWRSYAPDGREVVIRHRGALWSVRCGDAQAQSTNLDVALALTLRSDQDVIAHHRDLDYPSWIRMQADAIELEDEDDE